MIEVTETVAKSYDLDGLIERVKELESGLFAIKFYDFMLIVCLVLLFLAIIVCSVAHCRLNEFDKLLKEIKKDDL